MLTFTNMFVVGPLVGLCAIKLLMLAHRIKNLVLAKDQKEQRRLLNAIVVLFELGAIGFLALFCGVGIVFLSFPMLLVAQFIVAGEDDDDNPNRVAIEAAYRRCSAKVSFFAQKILHYAGKLQEAHKRSRSAQQAPVSENVTVQASTNDNVTVQTTANDAVSETVQASSHLVPSTCPRTSYNEEQLLQQLVTKVGQLQQWAARPEADRKAVAELTKQARELEEALFAAVRTLDTGTTDWKDICTHIEALSRHQLPAELSSALNELAKQRAGKLDDTRTDVAQLSNQLRSTANELKEKISTPVLSPEEVIETADAALLSAQQICSKAQQ